VLPVAAVGQRATGMAKSIGCRTKGRIVARREKQPGKWILASHGLNGAAEE
jgi:hypothetical protein